MLVDSHHSPSLKKDSSLNRHIFLLGVVMALKDEFHLLLPLQVHFWIIFPLERWYLHFDVSSLEDIFLKLQKMLEIISHNTPSRVCTRTRVSLLNWLFPDISLTLSCLFSTSVSANTNGKKFNL